MHDTFPRLTSRTTGPLEESALIVIEQEVRDLPPLHAMKAPLPLIPSIPNL